MILRPYRQHDLDRLYEIDTVCFPEGISYSRPELKYYVELRGAFTLVAEDPAARAVVGFIIAHRERKVGGHIITIDVLPDYRNKQIGSRLLQSAEERLWAAGAEIISLETAVTNTNAIRFYERHGYEIAQKLRGYYQGKLDAYLMVKRHGR